MSTEDRGNRPFTSGLDLAGLLYEAARPILAARFPGLPYSAALLGPGSEVLGFDTPQSMDHDWGPRLMLFLSEADHQAQAEAIDQALRRELPPEIGGYPTDLAHRHSSRPVVDRGPVEHGVKVLAVHRYFRWYLGFDPWGQMPAVDWLICPEQHLRSTVGGRVFHDGLGELAPLRARLGYYPRDVWLYLLAAQWRRIDQEEPFMGRCGQAGDELGSRLVAGRLVRDLMRLCFLMERQYAPYIKWFGTAFAGLRCAAYLTPMLSRALAGSSWQEREQHLSQAYEYVAAMQNALGLTEPIPARVSPFWDRPFQVIHADRFVDALRAAIRSEEVRSLPEHLGAVDQWIDSTDGLNPERSGRLGLMYSGAEGERPA